MSDEVSECSAACDCSAAARVKCFAVFQSGIVEGERSGHTRTFPGCKPLIDFYDQRGYQMWLGSDMVFDTQEEADAFWLSRY